jgi:hypothetical protein
MNTTSLPRTFADARRLIVSATRPSDIFGTLECDSINSTFRTLAKLVHPDKNPAQKNVAEEVFRKLEELRTKGENLCNPAPVTEPAPAPVTFSTKRGSYTILEGKAEGGMKGIFTGVAVYKKTATVPVLITVPHSAEDNDLMEREANALKAINAKVKELGSDPDGKALADKFRMRLPTLLESVRLEEPGQPKAKMVHVFAYTAGHTTGWYTLEEIRAAYPLGVGTKVMCFIWNRILEGLTLAHTAGIVHGAITPNHVLIHAKEHLGNIIDWTASARTGEKAGYVDTGTYGAYFPEELADARRLLVPATDIYMSAWCMVYLLGGDPVTRFIPTNVEAPIREFLNKCLQPSRRLRPVDAESAYRQFRQITKDVFGPRKFVGLVMPER